MDDDKQDEGAAGWYVDPTGRAELRFWDGEAWTVGVRSRSAQASEGVDPARCRRARRGRLAAVLMMVALVGASLVGHFGSRHATVRLIPALQSSAASVNLEPTTSVPPVDAGASLPPVPPRPVALAAPPPPLADTVAPPPSSFTLTAGAPQLAYAGDFPDPSIMLVGSTYWAYATGSAGRNLSVMSSPDLATWTDPVDALPVLPAWAATGFTWAPAILPVDGGYLLYYTARVAASGRQCISVAYSKTPVGPFLDVSHEPMICQLQSGGSIDPSAFAAPDGTRYLLWKSEDNALGSPSKIGVQKLAPDGFGVVGRGVALLAATAPWQDGVIEGPAMGFIDGRYVLFYGANHWDTPNAGIGYALCDGPMGPCVNQSVNGPWLGSTRGRVAPSGPALSTDKAGTTRLTFHAFVGTSSGRVLWTDDVRYSREATKRL